MRRNKNIQILCRCAILLALSIALSYVRIIRLPFSGSVTLVSMLPVCLVSILYGLKWGFGTAFCFSWFQILQGDVFAWGLTPTMLIAALLLDYILAYTVLGVSGLFRKKGSVGQVVGISLACILRFGMHFLSGVVLWANYGEFIAFGVEWLNRPVLYSFCYNGIYMLPETILTVIAAVIFLRVPQIRRLLDISDEKAKKSA